MKYINKKWLKNIAIGIALALLATTAVAKELSLKDAIMLSLRYNPNVRDAFMQRTIDKFSLRSAEHQFEPNFALSGSSSYSRTDGPATSTNTTGGFTTPISYSMTPVMTYSSPIGTTTTVTWNNSDAGNYSTSLDINVVQPLLQGFGSAVAEASLRAAFDNEYLSKITLKDTLISQVNGVISAYLTLVGDENNLITSKQAYESAKKTVWRNKQFIKAGRMAANDNVTAESQVAQQRLEITKTNNTIFNDKQALLKAIGYIDPNKDVSISTTIDLGSTTIPDLKKSINIALHHNIAYIKAAVAVRSAARTLMVDRDKARWKLDLTSGYSLSGQRGGIKGIFQSSATKALSLKLDLTVPLEDLDNHITILSDKLSLRKAVIGLKQARRDLILNVRNKINSLVNQKNAIKESQQFAELAKKSLEYEQIKLEHGMSTVVNVTNLRGNLVTAQLAVTTAKIGFLQARNDYYTTLGTTLKQWGIKLKY